MRCVDNDSVIAQLVGQLDQLEPEWARPENPGREHDHWLDDDGAVVAVEGREHVFVISERRLVTEYCDAMVDDAQ